MKEGLIILALGFCFALNGQKESIYCKEINDILRTASSFPFGIASGEPTDQGMVLMTNINPFKVSGLNQVKCQLSEAPNFKEVTRNYSAGIRIEDAYTVKIYTYGLAEGKTYYYRFIYGEDTSVIGKSKTIPKNPAQLRFAVVSCSNYEWGWFNGYESLSKDNSIDFVIHLGDYIYEYGPGVYGDKALPRKHLPGNEIISLVDYRSRYAQYRLDPQLQALHQQIPMVSIWDDHEIANDAYQNGAQNHQDESEGAWRIRKENAQKAYFEWLPITGNTQYQVRRNFHYGSLMDLYLLDERLEGRSKQNKAHSDDSDLNQTMLGKDQRTWLLSEMKASEATWKVIGNQVFFSSLIIPKGTEAVKKSPDMWDGYAAEREYLLDEWVKSGEKNILILTGDAHSSFGIDLKHKGHNLGQEWITPSISSANLNEKISSWKAWKVERKLKNPKVNPILNFINLRRHGYMVVELTQVKATCEWYFEKTVKRSKSKSKRKAIRSKLAEK